MKVPCEKSLPGHRPTRAQRGFGSNTGVTVVFSLRSREQGPDLEFLQLGSSQCEKSHPSRGTAVIVTDVPLGNLKQPCPHSTPGTFVVTSPDPTTAASR